MRSLSSFGLRRETRSGGERERERSRARCIVMHRDALLRVFVTPEYRWNVAPRPPRFSLSSRLQPPHATPRGFGCTRLSKRSRVQRARRGFPFFTAHTGVCAHLRYLNQKTRHVQRTDIKKMDILSANPDFSATFLETLRAPFRSLLPRKLMRNEEVRRLVLVSIF